ncbi:hypothetical protein KKZ39_17330 [Enterobacter hormaechei subsp. xiangfangensis]|nr:hypothetical protein [Enterobacter hormaechei subsp. xiangfangensis]
MITLTKEWLLKTIAEIEEERDAVPGAVNEDAVMSLAAMKLALASLEAEPVSVQDERYQHLSEIYHAQEKRLFKLVQRIKGESFDKYSHSPSQAIDVLESAIFGESAEEDSRAAMLQGAEPVTTAYKLPGPIKDNRLNSGAEDDDYYSGYQAGWNECLESVQVICEGNPDAK